MKFVFLATLGASLTLSLLGAEENPLVKTPKDKISYVIGMDIGRNITNQQVDINPEALAAGLKTIITGAKSLLTEEEARTIMTTFRTEMQAKQQARFKEMQAKTAEQNKGVGEKNQKEGETFLAENKTKPGVITTPSGLQYKIITKGTGKIPTKTDSVTAHYRGTFIDGKEFDSSYKRGQPFKTEVTRVIKGWTEALLMMPVGSKWQLFIPSDLAYGPGGQGIPPNAALLFDMELLTIEPPLAPAVPPAPPK